MLTRTALVGLAAAALLTAAAARAQDLQSFQTPSHNIFCIANPADAGDPASIRCDIQQQTSKRPAPPPHCDLDWGDSYFVNATGPGGLTCHGDTTANPSDPVLAYGIPWRAYGVTCVVETTGLTCKNGQGHGFFMSKASSRAF